MIDVLELVALANGAVWLVAIPRLWRVRARTGAVPTGAVAALLVACAIAALGGGLAPLLHPDLIDLEGARMVGGAWRAGMLTAGLYALEMVRDAER